MHFNKEKAALTLGAEVFFRSCSFPIFLSLFYLANAFGTSRP
jgi:hypothetical protein